MIIALDLDTGLRFEYTCNWELRADTSILIDQNTECFKKRGTLSYKGRMFIWNSRNGEPKCLAYVLALWKLVRAYEREHNCVYFELSRHEKKNASAVFHRKLATQFTSEGKHLRDL